MEKGFFLGDLFDFSLFKLYIFVMFVIGYFIFNIVYVVFFMYLFIKGEEMGFLE